MSFLSSLAKLSPAVITGLLSFYAPSANALTLNGSSGSWSNTVGGSGITTINNTDGVYSYGQRDTGENQVRWGSPAYSNSLFDKSGLGFAGVGSTSFNSGDIFELGTLSHFNNPIWGGTAAASTDLAINLDFAELGSQTFNFTLEIDETPNIAGTCVYSSDTACADKISWTNAISDQSFSIGEQAYTLELLGFRNTPDSAIVTDFISQEGGTSQASLYGRLNALTPTTPAASVPEPATLSGLAVVGLALASRSRRNKSKV